MISRRGFLKKMVPLVGGTGFLISQPVPSLLPGLLARENAGKADSRSAWLEKIVRAAPKARYWTSTEIQPPECAQCHDSLASLPHSNPEHKKNIVRCLLCAHRCMLKDGDRGRCRARLNVGGELRSLVYGRPLAMHTDPIEKKPFYHFLPGSSAFSFSTSGCPFRCKFCQNWEISQASPEDYDRGFFKPEDIVGESEKEKAPVIAFTYNEPTVFTEYLTDVARAAKKKGMRCVLISCGFMNEEPLKEMCEVLQAIKIDLKGFSEEFYKNVSSAELKPVLRSIKQVHKSGVHLEIVNLVVPTLNDSDVMLKGLAEWIAGELGPDVPVHFTRFHPDYQLLNLPPTPVTTLERAHQIAIDKGIHYAFVGNVPDHPGNNTYCPSCKKVVVKRRGFFILEKSLKDGACASCGQKIAGVWS